MNKAPIKAFKSNGFVLFLDFIFKNVGFKNCKKYRYWDSNKKAFNFDGMIGDLDSAPENSVIILQACAHNPTGINSQPSKS